MTGSASKLHFEDFAIGPFGEYGPRVVTAEEIKTFAAAFDPQPFHLDEEAAARHMVGGLCAPGMLTCCIMMRLLTDGFIRNSTSMGSPGCDEISYRAPVRPGDALTVRVTVLETRGSRTRPHMGFVKFAFDVCQAPDRVAAHVLTTIMFARRAPPDGAA